MKDFETLVKDATISTWGINPEAYDAGACFDELGADSLDVIELYMLVEEKLGIPDIPDDLNIQTPNELIEYLRNQAN